MDHSVFAIELCLRLEPRSRVRDELRRLVVSHPARTGIKQKGELLRKISEILGESSDLFAMGCWDFFDDDDRARSDYHMWANGMITEEGAREQPSGFPQGSGEPRYMTFTAALLLVNGHATERALADACKTPENQLWKRETFKKVLKALGRVDFAGVKSDVLYLIPGEEDWGLTEDDLKLPKFEYLRPIE
ncbi:MAG: hypothetical protein ABIT01_19685 [Thermoanaerobaculia bacterium]